MSGKHKRSRYFVDGRVQGALLLRACRYWMLSLATVGCLTALGCLFVAPGIPAFVSSREQMMPVLYSLGVGFGVSLLLLPIVLLDFIRFTNRFAGPMLRLRRCMKQLASGEPVSPLHFRDGDYWQDVAEAFNELLDRQQQRSSVQPTDEFERASEPVA